MRDALGHIHRIRMHEKKRGMKIGRCTASTIIFNSSHLKNEREREIIQKMDKVKYLDWSTQNGDRNETYTYSCLYHRTE